MKLWIKLWIKRRYNLPEDLHYLQIPWDIVGTTQRLKSLKTVKPADSFLGGNIKGFFGLEYCFLYNDWFVSARTGANRLMESTRETTVFTGGIGGGFGGINLDYAFQTSMETETSLGNTHRVTIEFSLDDLLKYLGKKPEELIGKHCYEVFHGLQECWADCPHTKTLAEGKTVSREVVDEKVGCPLLVTTSPIYNEKGEVEATVHIARDLTETKKAERERQELQNQFFEA